jgi:hypothetical protein
VKLVRSAKSLVSHEKHTCKKKKMMSTRLILSVLVIVPLVLHAVPGQACRMTPAGQLIDVDRQIGLATNVAIGQVVSATPLDGQDVEYRFLLLERLAGEPGNVFTIMGQSGSPGAEKTTFNDHADFSFWARGGGRLMNGADCVIHPTFAIGGSYLVFLGSPSTRRSFEKIRMAGGSVHQDDRWLTYVRQQLAKRQYLHTAAPSVSAEPGPDYERIGRFIYGFQRVMPRDQLDRKTLAARQLPPGLLLRAGDLADEFDHIVASNTVAEAELEATLSEAVAVQKLLAAWSDRGATATPSTR